MSKLALYDKPASKTFPGLEGVIFVGDHENGKDFHGTATNWVAAQTYKEFGQGLKVEQYAYSSRGGFVAFLEWAIANKIDVVSISWNLMSSPGDIYDIAMQKALDAGIIVVASPGNDGKDDKELSWPGRDPRVIAVGAWDNAKNTVAGYSSWGANVFVVAPGNYDIPAAGNMVHEEGTSFAAPVIAMYAAMWKELTGGTREEFAKFIQTYAKDVMQPGRDAATGWGLFSWPAGWKKGESLMQARNASNARGIDVSHYQGVIDWAKVKASGISFAFIKATEGQKYVDDKFATNLKNAKAAGVMVGAYHFCRAANILDAGKEADHFIQTVNDVGGFKILDLPPVLDIETKEAGTRAIITAVCQTWLSVVKSVAGRTPLIYTNNEMAANCLDKSLAVYPLWFARYGVNQPPAAGGWDKWTFFQYTDRGSVPGISGNVDMNEYCGTVEQLKKAYGGGYKMKPEDAQKIVNLMGAIYNLLPTTYASVEARTEINRLANEVRKAGGLPIK